jgi:hypothetical protein
MNRDLVKTSHRSTCKKRTRKFILTNRESRVMIFFSRSHSHFYLVSMILLDLMILLDSTIVFVDRALQSEITLDLANKTCVLIFAIKITFELNIISIARLYEKTTHYIKRLRCLRLFFSFYQIQFLIILFDVF